MHKLSQNSNYIVETFSNPDGRLSTFSFGVYKDFTKKYHSAPIHVVLSLASSPCTIPVNLGRLLGQEYSIRIEAFVDTNGDDGSLDLHIGQLTKKVQTRAKCVVTNTTVTATSVSETNLNIRVSYLPNKEVALFLYGIPGEVYVSPFVVENIPKLPIDGSLVMTGDIDTGGKRLVNLANPIGEKDSVHKEYLGKTIVIPRYYSFEALNITSDDISIASPMDFDEIKNLIFRDDYNSYRPSPDRWATLQTAASSGNTSMILFTLPVLVKITNISISSGAIEKTKNTTWELRILNDYLRQWSTVSNSTFNSPSFEIMYFDLGNINFPIRKFFIRLNREILPIGTKLGKLTLLTESFVHRIN